MVAKPSYWFAKKGCFSSVWWCRQGLHNAQDQDDPTSHPSTTRFRKDIYRWVQCIWGWFRGFTYAKGDPIAFYSKGLSHTALSKSVYEKELIALVLADKKWRSIFLTTNSWFETMKGAYNMFWKNKSPLSNNSIEWQSCWHTILRLPTNLDVTRLPTLYLARVDG